MTKPFPKSKAVELRLEVSEYKDVKYVNLREWVVMRGGTDFIPTKKGITVKQSEWAEFMAWMKKFDASQEATNRGTDSNETRTVYLAFDKGEKRLPDEAVMRAFSDMLDETEPSLSKIKPSKRKVVYAAKVKGKKVLKVKRYATYKDGDWEKL